MAHRSLLVATGLAVLSLRILGGCSDSDEPASDASNNGGAGGDQGVGGACEPATCASTGTDCGTIDDGCGSAVRCGDPCSAGGSSGLGGDGSGNTGPCTPTSCEAEGKECGSIPNGCGEELDCGTCANADCGAVIPNVCGCPAADEVLSSNPRTARRARSVGFGGDVGGYDELSQLSCETPGECALACLDKGGEQTLCDAAECSAFGVESQCSLPPIWRYTESIAFESDNLEEATVLVTVFSDYHDTLVADQFELEVPEAAEIRGLTMEIRKAGDDSSVTDDSVRIVKGGQIGNTERYSPQLWPTNLSWVSYGGPDDLWGEEWTPAELNADDFGIALSAAYTSTAGNARAYVDQVRVTVHYTIGCAE